MLEMAIISFLMRRFRRSQHPIRRLLIRRPVAASVIPLSYMYSLLGGKFGGYVPEVAR